MKLYEGRESRQKRMVDDETSVGDTGAITKHLRADLHFPEYNYFVSTFRLMFTWLRLSNWLTVFVSLLRPLYCAYTS